MASNSTSSGTEYEYLLLFELFAIFSYNYSGINRMHNPARQLISMLLPQPPLRLYHRLANLPAGLLAIPTSAVSCA